MAIVGPLPPGVVKLYSRIVQNIERRTLILFGNMNNERGHLFSLFRVCMACNGIGISCHTTLSVFLCACFQYDLPSRVFILVFCSGDLWLLECAVFPTSCLRIAYGVAVVVRAMPSKGCCLPPVDLIWLVCLLLDRFLLFQQCCVSDLSCLYRSRESSVCGTQHTHFQHFAAAGRLPWLAVWLAVMKIQSHDPMFRARASVTKASGMQVGSSVAWCRIDVHWPRSHGTLRGHVGFE